MTDHLSQILLLAATLIVCVCAMVCVWRENRRIQESLRLHVEFARMSADLKNGDVIALPSSSETETVPGEPRK